jgi:hypothetical protein
MFSIRNNSPDQSWQLSKYYSFENKNEFNDALQRACKNPRECIRNFESYAHFTPEQRTQLLASALFEDDLVSPIDKCDLIQSIPFLQDNDSLVKKLYNDTNNLILVITGLIPNSLEFYSDREQAMLIQAMQHTNIQKEQIAHGLWLFRANFLLSYALTARGFNEDIQSRVLDFITAISSSSQNFIHRNLITNKLSKIIYDYKEILQEEPAKHKASKAMHFLAKAALIPIINDEKDLQFIKLVDDSMDSDKCMRFYHMLFFLFFNEKLSHKKKKTILSAIKPIKSPLGIYDLVLNLLDLANIGKLDDFLRKADSENFRELLHEFNREALSINLDFSIDLKKYLNVVFESRSPGSLLRYSISLKNKTNNKTPLYTKSSLLFGVFVNTLLSGIFKEYRYATGFLDSILTKEKKKLWATNLEEKKFPPYTVAETDDWEDLFLCASDIERSCLSIYDGIYNQALLSYLLDGKTRIAVIKDSKGRIVARRILRILSDGQGPVLFKERLYKSGCVELPQNVSKALEDICKRKAQMLGIDLVRSFKPQEVENDSKYEKKSYSKDLFGSVSVTGYEYVDANIIKQVTPDPEVEPNSGPKLQVESIQNLLNRGYRLNKESLKKVH